MIFNGRVHTMHLPVFSLATFGAHSHQKLCFCMCSDVHLKCDFIHAFVVHLSSFFIELLCALHCIAVHYCAFTCICSAEKSSLLYFFSMHCNNVNYTHKITWTLDCLCIWSGVKNASCFNYTAIG